MKPLIEWQTLDGQFISSKNISDYFIQKSRKFLFFKKLTYWVFDNQGKYFEVSKETYESIKRFM